jgi:hypothetical protein
MIQRSFAGSVELNPDDTAELYGMGKVDIRYSKLDSTILSTVRRIPFAVTKTLSTVRRNLSAATRNLFAVRRILF